MITKSEPLSQYLQQFRDGGVDVAAFPTQSGKRYALRIVDPDDASVGLSFIAAFSSNLREADRPSDDAGQVKANRNLDHILNDAKAMARYSACHCVIDSDSISQFPDKYTEDDLGKTFVIISAAGTATSDSYREIAAEKKVTRTTRR